MNKYHFVVSLLVCIASSVAHADEIVVFAAGATKEVELRISPIFSSQTGARVVSHYDTVGALRDRLMKGEHADIVMISSAAVSALDGQHLLSSKSRLRIGLIGVAIAVKAGLPLPDISSAEALKNTLLGATSIAYADPLRGATAGTHFEKVLKEIGVFDQVKSRTTVLPFGVDVIDAVSTGRFQLGVSQSSEIILHPSVTLVGRLPDPYALTTLYVATATADSPLADRYLQLLASSNGKDAIVKSGFLD